MILLWYLIEKREFEREYIGEFTSIRYMIKLWYIRGYETTSYKPILKC